MKGNAVAWAALIVSLAALLSSQNLMRTAPAIQEIPAEGQRIAAQLSSAFEAVAEFSKSSVVQINAERKLGNGRGGPGGRGGAGGDAPRQMTPDELKKFRDRLREFEIEPQQFGEGPSLQGTGSGFVFDDKGHILTNNHVVEGADTINVVFHDGRRRQAKLVARDPKTDVAVIKVENHGYRALPIGDSDKLKVGEWVVSIGSPFGLEQSVTAGIVSAKGRGSLDILGADGYGDFIQTDCAINPGNSGGPLIDMRGRVIAINTAIATSSRSNSGVGFAIPINLAKEIALRLIQNGKVQRALLGVEMIPLSPDDATKFKLAEGATGVVIMNVIPNGPAEKAGLKKGDVVLRFQGKSITNSNSFRKNIFDSPVGSKVKLDVQREGKEVQLELTLADSEEVKQQMAQAAQRESQKNAPKNPAPADDEETAEAFGMTVQAITPAMARGLGLSGNVKGLIIIGVTRGSIAQKAGIEPGMMIDQVVHNKKAHNIQTLKDFEDVVKDAKSCVVRVISPSGTNYIGLEKP